MVQSRRRLRLDGISHGDAGAIGNYQFQSNPQLIADVQSWLLDPANNHGWIIVGPEGDEQTARRIDSRESASIMSRPLLTVQYTLPQVADVPLPFWSLGLLALGLFGAASRAAGPGIRTARDTHRPDR